MNRTPLLGLLAALLALASCDGAQIGNYFYTANVQGYVMDSKTDGGGVSNATVYLYTTDPAATLAATPDKVPTGYLVSTSTSNGNNTAGQYTSKVVWNNPNGAYGTKGDTTTIYAVVTHPDYATTAFTIPGVLSDFTNNLVDLKVKRITYTTANVTGRVVDVNGDGVNNVRVVLYLDPAAVADSNNAPDYTATTATANNVVGTFTFTNVTWKDAAATNGTSQHQVLIKVSDNNYTATQTLTPTLISGSDSDLTSTTISVTRKPHYDFSTNLTGRVLNRYKGNNGNSDSGVAGVSVTVTYATIDADGTLKPNQKLTVKTNANGTWTAFLQWHDPTPGRWLQTDATTYTPASDHSTIPTGEAGLLVDVEIAQAYSVSSGTAGNSGAKSGFVFSNDSSPVSNTSTTYYPHGGSSAPTGGHFEVDSWTNTNNFPDLINTNY